MDQNSQTYYEMYDNTQKYQPGDVYDESPPYDEPFMEEYEEETTGGEDYSVYAEEDGVPHRPYAALNILDTFSVLIGVVAILALTSIIVSLISWVYTDIAHSFVILQSNIQ